MVLKIKANQRKAHICSECEIIQKWN